jgi:hypothetical protein
MRVMADTSVNKRPEASAILARLSTMAAAVAKGEVKI